MLNAKLTMVSKQALYIFGFEPNINNNKKRCKHQFAALFVVSCFIIHFLHRSSSSFFGMP